MSSASLWMDKMELPRFEQLKHNTEVDIAIIGGGVTGVTTAYLLKDSKKKVALVERNQCGGGDSSFTTAHLTMVPDSSLQQLTKNFGEDQARAVYDAGKTALLQIKRYVRKNEISCELAIIPAFLSTSLTDEDPKQLEELQNERQIVERLGLQAHWWNTIPLFNRPGIGYPNQARFHPLKYLKGLLEKIERSDSCVIFENSEVMHCKQEKGKIVLTTPQARLTCSFLVIATHVPLIGTSSFLGAGLFQSKLAPFSSYVVCAEIPKGSVPDALYWDMTNPYYYARLSPAKDLDYLILGGADHKTGQVMDTNECYMQVEKLLLELCPQARVVHRWSGQVIQTSDGLPFIGLSDENQFISTGYNGNGYTFATIGAMMARDAIFGSDSPWKTLFAVDRKPSFSNALKYLKENADYPYYMLKDRLPDSNGSNETSIESVRCGEGSVLMLNGKRSAVYRKENGNCVTLSPVCTHLGCIVHWNNAEKTWDCPCHGSRFHPTGEVLAGPAERPLSQCRDEQPLSSRGNRKQAS